MKKLERRLGLVHVTCIASGALISSGLFVLPGIAHARAGPAVLISYLLAGVLATIGLLSVAELALSEDCLVPAVFSRLQGRTEMPWVAILCTSALLGVALLVPLGLLVESASVVFILVYILASLAVVVLREGKVQNYRHVFHAPLYPYLQVLGIAGFLFVLIEMGTAALLVTSALVCAALSVYWFYGRHWIRTILDVVLSPKNQLTTYKDIANAVFTLQK